VVQFHAAKLQGGKGTGLGLMSKLTALKCFLDKQVSLLFMCCYDHFLKGFPPETWSLYTTLLRVDFPVIRYTH